MTSVDPKVFRTYDIRALVPELVDEPWALPVPGTLIGALFAAAFEANGVPYPPRCFKSR